jgi:hypothetical protein
MDNFSLRYLLERFMTGPASPDAFDPDKPGIYPVLPEDWEDRQWAKLRVKMHTPVPPYEPVSRPAWRRPPQARGRLFAYATFLAAATLGALLVSFWMKEMTGVFPPITYQTSCWVSLP